MDRLNFTIPDFTRIAWTGLDVRRHWEPRITEICHAWSRIEILSVNQGIRQAALIGVSKDNIDDAKREWAKLGLNHKILASVGSSRYPYANATTSSENADDVAAYRVVLGKGSITSEACDAFTNRDSSRIGELLGYPECCTKFFEDTWVQQGFLDTTWSMAIRSKTATRSGNQVIVPLSPMSNILWRWAGIRPVFHLPCQFGCRQTEAVAKPIFDLLSDAGFKVQSDWLRDCLSFPVEWSALHGIAEIKNPLFKISSRTDATGQKYSVAYEGDRYPSINHNGIRFPFNRMVRGNGKETNNAA